MNIYIHSFKIRLYLCMYVRIYVCIHYELIIRDDAHKIKKF